MATQAFEDKKRRLNAIQSRLDETIQRLEPLAEGFQLRVRASDVPESAADSHFVRRVESFTVFGPDQSTWLEGVNLETEILDMARGQKELITMVEDGMKTEARHFDIGLFLTFVAIILAGVGIALTA
jgi:hypothetical protein